MPTNSFTITGSGLCQPNEGHIDLTVTGDISASRPRQDLQDIKLQGEAGKLDQALMTLLAWHFRNTSNANAKAQIQTGVTFTIVS